MAAFVILSTVLYFCTVTICLLLLVLATKQGLRFLQPLCGQEVLQARFPQQIWCASVSMAAMKTVILPSKNSREQDSCTFNSNQNLELKTLLCLTRLQSIRQGWYLCFRQKYFVGTLHQSKMSCTHYHLKKKKKKVILAGSMDMGLFCVLSCHHNQIWINSCLPSLPSLFFPILFISWPAWLCSVLKVTSNDTRKCRPTFIAQHLQINSYALFREDFAKFAFL